MPFHGLHAQLTQRFFSPYRPDFPGPQDIVVDIQMAASPMTFESRGCRGTDMTVWSRALLHRGTSRAHPDMVLQSQRGMTNSRFLPRPTDRLTD